jgi:hypothetical protein
MAEHLWVSAIRRLKKKGNAMKNVVDCLAIADCGMDTVHFGEMFS